MMDSDNHLQGLTILELIQEYAGLKTGAQFYEDANIIYLKRYKDIVKEIEDIEVEARRRDDNDRSKTAL